jgi:hypothetical protein
MSKSDWNDEFLNEMRGIGDPLADRAINALFETAGDNGATRVRGLLQELFQNRATGNGHALLRSSFGNVDHQELPEAVRQYLEEGHRLPGWANEHPNPALIREGGELALQFGLMMATILACASLPECYVMARGVKVLAITGQLDAHTHRRLMETAQFAMDVATPGHIVPPDAERLDPDNLSPGVASALRVRLMHAAIRHLIQRAEDGQPLNRGSGVTAAEVYSSSRVEASDGTPINQEDLAYTLMTFSYVPIRVMKKFTNLSDDLAEAFITRWNIIGHCIGVREELLPANLAEAEILFETIKARQAGRSTDGIGLTKHLRECMRHMMPIGLKLLPDLLTHLYIGEETAEIIGIRTLTWFDKLKLLPLRWLLRFSLTTIDDQYLAHPHIGHISVWLHRRILIGLAGMNPDGFRIAPHFWDVEVFGNHKALSD